MKAGAGGNWTRFDEKFDRNIVKQTDLSCVSAVGEMLLRDRGVRVPQEKLRDIIGEPAYFGVLAKTLNHFDSSDDGRIWKGFSTNEAGLLTLVKEQNIGVILVEPRFLGHAVMVMATKRSDVFDIKDPFDQTSYSMHAVDFWSSWGGFVIARL
jgi:hypothetical protein